MSDKTNRREVLQACTAVAALCYPMVGLRAQVNARTPPHPGPPRVASPEGPRLILDRALYPQRFQEAPALAALVRQNRLPRVEERIGEDPIVIAPLREIGRYGGTLRRAFLGPTDYQSAIRCASGPDGFLYWDYQWRTVIPNIARAFELSRDGRSLTLLLRRGMRWSDGHPFTADDVMFWYTDMYRDRRVVSSPSATMELGGKAVLIERLDAQTIQFIAPKTYPLLPELLASATDIGGPSFTGRLGMGGFAPKHYLSQFHAKYRSETELTRQAREAGFSSWSAYLKNRNDWTLNSQLPVVSPWLVESPINQQKYTLVRNPYSIWVDTAGNQLPYIDRIRHTLCSTPEVVSFKAVTGELDFQDRHLDVAKLPILLSNRARSGYEVFLDPFEGTDLGVRINVGYQDDPEIGALLGNVSFRRALSQAIDRDAINESFMLGMGRPSAAVPSPENKYFPGAEWATRWARLNLSESNRLLDGLGLSARDASGFRLRRDGKGRIRLVCQAFPAHVDFPAVSEMIKEHWRAVGIDLDVQVVESSLWLQRILSGAMQLTIQLSGAEDPLCYPEMLFPYSPYGPSALTCPDYARWFQSLGRAGREPPPEIRAMMDLWRRGQSAGAEERMRIGRELIKMHADQVLSIGLISAGLSTYGMHLAKKTLGNVPRRVVNTFLVRSPSNALPMTFFFRAAGGGRESPAPSGLVDAQLKGSPS